MRLSAIVGENVVLPTVSAITRAAPIATVRSSPLPPCTLLISVLSLDKDSYYHDLGIDEPHSPHSPHNPDAVGKSQYLTIPKSFLLIPSLHLPTTFPNPRFLPALPSFSLTRFLFAHLRFLWDMRNFPTPTQPHELTPRQTPRPDTFFSSFLTPLRTVLLVMGSREFYSIAVINWLFAD